VRDTDPRVRKGQTVDTVDHRTVNWIEWHWFVALDAPGAADEQDAQEHDRRLRHSHEKGLPNGPRLSCGALKNDSFLNLRAPPASSAC